MFLTSTRTAKQNEIEFVKKVPQHPRDRLAQKAKNNDEVQFIKKVHVHPRDRLARKTKNNDKVQFIKKVFVHPHDRLARKTKNNDEVQFIKKVPIHPRDALAHKTKSKPKKSQLIHPRKRLQEKATKIAQNSSKLVGKNKYKFNVKEMLNKGQLFDLNKTTENQIICLKTMMNFT